MVVGDRQAGAYGRVPETALCACLRGDQQLVAARPAGEVGLDVLMRACAGWSGSTGQPPC